MKEFEQYDLAWFDFTQWAAYSCYEDWTDYAQQVELGFLERILYADLQAFLDSVGKHAEAAYFAGNYLGLVNDQIGQQWIVGENFKTRPEALKQALLKGMEIHNNNLSNGI